VDKTENVAKTNRDIELAYEKFKSMTMEGEED
jgi:hypothetical protein